MKHEIVEIDKISPDKNQPRKYINAQALDEMAVSIKNEGVINSIEIDDNFIIVTGEQRWRASKMAGLTKIPVKILQNLSDKNRFIRQVQENIHHNTMSPLDTAEALDKIRKWILSSEELKISYGGSRHGQPGTRKLHDLLGIPESTISEILDLLGTTGELREALKDPKFSRTKIAEIKEVPEKYKKRLEHIIATQKTLPRDTVRTIARALKRADKYEEHTKADELLKQNFEGLSTLQTLSKINKIVPNEESRIKEPGDALKLISEKVINLMEVLDEHMLESFDELHKPLVVRDLNALGFYIQSYLRGKKINSTKSKLLGGAK